MTTGDGNSRPRVLFVEDEPEIARAIARQYTATWDLDLAGSITEAAAMLDGQRSLEGAILDIGLPDGSGLEVLAKIRRSGRRCPVLVFSGHFERCLAANIQLHGAEYLPKPGTFEHLQAFAERVSEYARGTSPQLRCATEHFIQAHGLTRREAELVTLLVLDDLPRSELARRMGISSNTVKAHVRSLLRKSKFRTMGGLLPHVRRAARSPG